MADMARSAVVLVSQFVQSAKPALLFYNTRSITPGGNCRVRNQTGHTVCVQPAACASLDLLLTSRVKIWQRRDFMDRLLL